MKPFNDYDLGIVLSSRLKEAYTKIDAFSNEEIMQNDLDLLANNIYEEFNIPLLIVNDEDTSRRFSEQKKIKRFIHPFYRDEYDQEYIFVDGIKFKFYYPFTGEKDLLKCRPSSILLGGYPEITIEDDCLVISLEKALTEIKPDNIKQEIENAAKHNFDEIISALNTINSSVNAFNNSLKERASEELKKKKTKVMQFYEASKILEIPIEKKEYAKKIIPLEKRIMPIAHRYNKEDYYCITESDYSSILSTIRHTLSTYESTPCSYRSLNEEDLRNTLLSSLNATYLGKATGEAFRHMGKTDICIEQSNRAAFVAECKIWSGSKKINTAILQLDSYLTWRDCKTALIFFVRNKDFIRIIDSVKDALEKINGLNVINETSRNEIECSFNSRSNIGQVIKIRIMLFNLYCPNQKK